MRLQREGVALNCTAMLRWYIVVHTPQTRVHCCPAGGHPKMGLGKTLLLTGRSRGPPHRPVFPYHGDRKPRGWQMLRSQINRTTRIPEARHLRRGTPGPGMNEPVSDREHQHGQHSTTPSLTSRHHGGRGQGQADPAGLTGCRQQCTACLTIHR